MTSNSPCKLIRYEDFCYGKRSATYRSTQPAGHHTHILKNNSSKACSGYGTGTATDFDDRLRAFENNARRRYLNILNTLTFTKLPSWLDQMLEQNVLPILHRLGFEKPLSKKLFEIAPAAWKLMGPVNGKVVAFHPVINREVEEVRQGLKLKDGNNSNRFPRSAGAPPGILSGSIKNSIAPESLFDLLGEIATPWIILPRASRFLEKQHCQYLPAYLRTINNETRESSLKLFSRITVEFVANFSLNFADRHHPKDQLTKLLFYGYATLLWKTLRCPPENMENSAAFDSFFTWISRLARKSDVLGQEENAVIDQMMKIKTMVFPTSNFNRQQNHSRSDSSRFMITLRHGYMGMTNILKYFGIDPFLQTRQVGDRFACPSKQNELHGLLRAIQKNYHLESKRTRGYIKQLVDYLSSACGLMQSDIHRAKRDFLNRMFNNLHMLFVK